MKLLWCICAIVLLSESKAPTDALTELPCEVGNITWTFFHIELVTCTVNVSITQNLVENYVIKPSIEVPEDNPIEVFTVHNNKKFDLLPQTPPDFFADLDVLQVSNCDLQKISKYNFKGMATLIYLWLYSNSLQSIDDDTFDELINLEWLDLRSNRIEILHARTFNELRNLKHLSLSSNKLRFVTPRLFENILHVQEIYLTHNLLTEIYSDTFQNNKDLAILSLANNSIRYMSETMLDGIVGLNAVNLDGNACITGVYGHATNSFKTFELMKFEILRYCQASKEIAELLFEQKDLINLFEDQIGKMESAYRIERESLKLTAKNCELNHIINKNLTLAQEDLIGTLKAEIDTLKANNNCSTTTTN